MALIPGNPVFSRIDKGISSQELNESLKAYSLRQNWTEKLEIYARRCLTLDFGTSLVTGENIRSELWVRVKNTAVLALLGLVLFTFLGTGFAILGAYFSGTWLDQSLKIITSLFISTPVFWFGLMLMAVFSLTLNWFPASGTESASALVLPALTVGLRPAAFLQRILQARLLDILSMPFIQVAYAKGLSSLQVLYRHALRNALVPVVTIIGVEFGSLLTGAVVAETIFSYKGVGTYLLQAISARDYNVILATVLVTCLFVVLVNLVVDWSYKFLDPRLEKPAN
jgi:peptide/nickel transport system permease protein